MGLYSVMQSVIKKIRQELNVLKGEESKDKVFSSKHEYKNLQDARDAFMRSKSKLFDVDQWSQMQGISSTFELYGTNGQRKSGKNIAVGDYILINLPGPLPENWVRITSLVDQEEVAEFVVSPSEKPFERENNDEKVSHFFKDDATSTFRVERVGKCLIAFEIGKNEIVNNDGEQAGGRDWINTMMAEGGWLGFQKLQWKNLTEYLVHLNNIEGAQNE
ncbi:MAG: hypothetical protein R6V72_04140 [Cyclobacterium sp.]|uniref:hypothetical protein n=1 Tax=Cyclobacterium sp. TaxID=1966343 RepID=UPI0039708BC0